MTKEIIKEINYTYGEENFEGVKITTNLQTIKLLVSDGQCCCEYAGYIVSDDDVSSFIGAELLNVRTVDKANERMNVALHKEFNDEYYFNDDGDLNVNDGGVCFVDIVTNKGVLQFAVYNIQNGYYGHDIKIISNQLKIEDTL